MIGRSNVRFADLKQLLMDLGFTSYRKDRFWIFKHETSEALFAFRAYRSNERVTLRDLRSVQVQLDWRGMMSEKTFDDYLHKATA